jgi:hypothetical protein
LVSGDEVSISQLLGVAFSRLPHGFNGDGLTAFGGGSLGMCHGKAHMELLNEELGLFGSDDALPQLSF